MSKKLRNFGIITDKDYIGKTLEEATKFAEEGGFIVRITENDGRSFALTMDFRADRINFQIRNNIVIDVNGG